MQDPPGHLGEPPSPERLTVSLHPDRQPPEQGFRAALPRRRRTDQVEPADPPRRAGRLLHPDALSAGGAGRRCSGSRWRWSSCSTARAACRAARSSRPKPPSSAPCACSSRTIRSSSSASPSTPRTSGDSAARATPENVQRGLQYLQLAPRRRRHDDDRRHQGRARLPPRPATAALRLLLTDGYIGNETEILGEIHKRLGASRIFSFGIGSSVNRYLIDHMAKAGRGAVAYLGLKDSAAQIMDDFFERISHPALTDLQIDWGGLEVSARSFPRAARPVRGPPGDPDRPVRRECGHAPSASMARWPTSPCRWPSRQP